MENPVKAPTKENVELCVKRLSDLRSRAVNLVSMLMNGATETKPEIAENSPIQISFANLWKNLPDEIDSIADDLSEALHELENLLLR